VKLRSLKGRLTVVVAVAGLLTVAALTAGFNILLRSNLDSDADRVLQARAAGALEGVEVSRGQVKIRDAPDQAAPESGVWIFDHAREIERPVAPVGEQALARSLASSGASDVTYGPRELRLHASPIRDGASRVGTAVVALSLEPYERSANRALIASLIFAFVVLALVIVTTRLVVGRALSPVARMTSAAADWSEHDLDHRFNLGPPRDELTQLASTFDSMLARIGASLRHEQRLTAEVSHELRTPLAAIAAEAELALRKPRADEEYRAALVGVKRGAAHLAEILETLLLAARNEALPGNETADADTIAERAIESFRQGQGADSPEVELRRAGRPLLVDAGLSTASRVLAPLLENARRYGRGRLGVEVTSTGENALFSISDDGPGIAAGEGRHIFEPGSRGSAGRGRDDRGAGLGLALARRLARALGGDVVAAERDDGGLVQVTLPLAGPR
jgi:signal transduction histidine kinase